MPNKNPIPVGAVTVDQAAAALQPSKGLYSKLAEVMAEVSRVEKRGYNDFHKYQYVREDDLVEAVRGALAQREITLIPSATSLVREGTLSTVHVRFVFADGESGQTHEAEWYGTGDDKGDKGLYKAYTGALKYFLMKSFLIPTGDDPEADTKTDKRASKAKPAPPADNGRIDAERVTQIKRGIKLVGISGDELKKALGAAGADSGDLRVAIDNLTPKQADELEALLASS